MGFCSRKSSRSRCHSGWGVKKINRPSATPSDQGMADQLASLVPRAALKRDVAMLLGGIGIALVGEHLQRVDQARPSVARFDDVIQVAAGGGDIVHSDFLYYNF